MRIFVVAGALALMLSSAALAAGALDYAYPRGNQNLPRPDPDEKVTVTGAGGKTLTRRQVGDAYNPPDWFPEDHAPMPPIVAKGRAPNIPACALCHLTIGNGHPESASISGLPVRYIIEQMHEFKRGNRDNIRAPAMIRMAKDITEAELRAAAEYYAAIPRARQKWIRVVESATAPDNYVSRSGGRFLVKGSTRRIPIGPYSIYEIAENDEVAYRNPRVGYVAYVPEGSIAKGRAIAYGQRGHACGQCHGADWRGKGNVPRLAGRSTYYLMRQLNDVKIGARKGPAVADMKRVLARMNAQDIVNVAAFMASRQP